MDDPFAEAFAPLIGLLCWRVERGHGSMLSFQFGEPSPAIREPFASLSPLAEMRASAAGRRGRPVGAWCLLVSCCHWRIVASGALVADDDGTHDRIAAAAQLFDGQRLARFELDAAGRRAIFGFDLGAGLETWPYGDDDHDEQWSLYLPDGNVLTYRAGGAFNLDPGDTHPDRIVWRPAERSIRVP